MFRFVLTYALNVFMKVTQAYVDKVRACGLSSQCWDNVRKHIQLLSNLIIVDRVDQAICRFLAVKSALFD